MNDEWQEIPIEYVKPGDVARCNWREFKVTCVFRDGRVSMLATGGGSITVTRDEAYILGFTFHRRVKREPRTVIREVELGGSGACGVIGLPLEWKGSRVRVTEILDGEGNGGGG